MSRVHVLTPAPDYPEDYRWAYDVEAAALEAGGLGVAPVPWTRAGALGAGDTVLPLVAWGYHLDAPRWHAMLDRLEASGANVINSVPVLRWNSDKAYLAELGAAGVPTIESRVVAVLGEDDLAKARRAWGGDIVVKPPVSASATGTYRLGPDDPLPGELAGRAAIFQPFLESVTSEGEYSLLLFDGALSHAVVKRPKDGDYRVQPHLGGREGRCDAPESAVEIAHAALAVAPGDCAYARVDLVRGRDGGLKVIELELIEPSLWLQHAPDGGASFAAAIRRRIQP
ncbi:ATP-grasp domain-containing protein [Sphingomonas mesophila]|uniref:ATP-grasp domain-containing protein n=1 Tax=Sphingomonas mesophila TaxID=2303576 RepID=UPI000E56FAD7|nr:hypothetical protein [Sphingomonas mesophila]